MKKFTMRPKKLNLHSCQRNKEGGNRSGLTVDDYSNEIQVKKTRPRPESVDAPNTN